MSSSKTDGFKIKAADASAKRGNPNGIENPFARPQKEAARYPIQLNEQVRYVFYYCKMARRDLARIVSPTQMEKHAKQKIIFIFSFPDKLHGALNILCGQIRLAINGFANYAKHVAEFAADVTAAAANA